MLVKAVRQAHRAVFTPSLRYNLLDHKKMDEVKKMLYTDRQKTWMLKARFILKEGKYTLVQGTKDLWHDAKWFINLYKTKKSHEFTGYEMVESHRIKIDMIKFIPYSVILVVPLAELSLPIILWLFPNAVPSFYLFDTAWDQRIEKYEQVQFESHKFLIDKLTDVLSKNLHLQPMVFSQYQFFKSGYFELIDDLDKHLDYTKFSSDQLIKVLQFLGGGQFITGTQTINKVINLFTLNIPRLLVKICLFLFSKIFRVTLAAYEDPFFVKGYFDVFKFNYFPFEYLKCKFLIWQIRRKFKNVWNQDRAFEKFGMDDVIGNNIKEIARERGLATLSCYETLKNVIKNDWVKFTTHPKFKNNNTKLWYSVMMYTFLKESSRQIN